MAALSKGALSVIVVVGVAIAIIATLMDRSPDAGPRAGRGGTPTGAPAGKVGANAPAPGGQGNTPAAPGAGQAGAGSGAGSAAPRAAQVAAPPPRKSTDFSAVDEPWRHALDASTDKATALAIANGGKSSAGLAGCSSCHGAQGIPAAGTNFPALAGSSPEYLAKQLMDYRSGARQNVIMASIAKGLDEGEIGALARYYGDLPPPALPAAVSGGRGQQLHDFGDNGLALAACANCHGARGSGESPLLPRLAGQPPAYFTSQMEAFRNGSRANDDVGTMRAIAQRLTPADTAALAQYYAGGH
ncbi:cytochrome C552 [Achromobacter aloeverae]|uniref:Cytochrome C552 n=2 Tax=Achromobacter aloeverae TaxID=1750518 RepID=A0A4Q1HGR5_9BURK|nr:cytochrome C552 [Achromobacter aloeverae]